MCFCKHEKGMSQYSKRVILSVVKCIEVHGFRKGTTLVRLVSAPPALISQICEDEGRGQENLSKELLQPDCFPVMVFSAVKVPPPKFSMVLSESCDFDLDLSPQAITDNLFPPPTTFLKKGISFTRHYLLKHWERYRPSPTPLGHNK